MKGRATRWLVVAAVALAAVATVRAPAPIRAQKRSEYVHHRHFRVRGPDGESQRALAIFPRRNDRQDHPDGARYPLVVALHGRAESLKGVDRGYLGWAVDYLLADAYGALGRERVPQTAYRGFVTDAHLRVVNEELDEDPFEGCLVVTPYVPDLSTASPRRVEHYVDWLAGSFLEQVREQFTAARTRAGTGIDGVSLGGWIALEAGLRHPDVFGAVGGIQPAIPGRAHALAERAADARKKKQTQHIRLLTSRGDPFRATTRKLSRALRNRHVPHRLLVLPGPHDYEFNRGPAAMELLRFHEQVLAREPLEE